MKSIDTIVIVDDDAICHMAFRKVIENTGIARHIISFESAEEGLTWLQKHPAGTDKVPSLILLDIDMPCMDGWDFLKEFHKMNLPQKEDIKIIMLTSSLFPKDRIRAGQYNEVVDFMVKPITASHVKEIVSKHF